MVKTNKTVVCTIPKFLVSYKENKVLWTEIFHEQIIFLWPPSDFSEGFLMTYRAIWRPSRLYR